MLPPPWINFTVALAIGLLIGLERERSKGEGPLRRAAGIRTFALASLIGAVSMHVGGAPLLALVVAAVAVLTALSYLKGSQEDPGLTTEIALVLTPLVGALAMADTLVAGALAACIAVVLAMKDPIHRFVKGVLTDEEVGDGLIFAIATLVIWPLLPDRFVGPLDAVNPHKVWLLVVLILAIGAAGHVAMRLLGLRFGLAVAGFASGFVSSLVTIGAMAGRAGRDPTALDAAVAGAALSTVATYLQLAALLYVTSAETFFALAWPLAAGAVAAALYGLVFTLRALRSEEPADSAPGRAFSLRTALVLAATMTLMLVGVAALEIWFGETGVVAGVALAGIVDAHSASISAASLVLSGQLQPHQAVVPILAAVSTNAAAKIVMAASAGSASFALRTAPGIVLSVAAVWLVVAITGEAGLPPV
tara:strand:- start:2212 stop:3471 length:1260 start_codon:yes stop_codon:yes gene_type:complete